MKNKKRTTYLLLAVVAIYAAIIVRFFMLSNDTESLGFKEASSGDFKPTQYEVQEDFTIVNNYRDPFLGALPSRKRSTVKTDIPKQPLNTSYYPEIRYLGIISDSKSSAKVVSLRVNGREYVIREGKSIDSIQILTSTTQSVIVSYKGKEKTINISGQ